MQQTEELRACRACLATDCELHELKENGLSEKFQQVTSLRLCPIDGMPKHICSFCRGLLLKTYQFRIKCLETDKIMLRKAGVLDCVRHAKKASMMHGLSVTDIMVVAFGGENEYANYIDQLDSREAVVMKHHVAVKKEPAEIDHFQKVDGYFVDETVIGDNQVLSNDESHIPNTANELAMDIYPKTVIQTECNIKDDLFEISLKNEIDKKIIEWNDSHATFNEETIHNTEVDILKKEIQSSAISSKILDLACPVVRNNAIDIHDVKETIYNAKLDHVKQIEKYLNAIDKKSAISTKRKPSTILKGNTMKRLKLTASINGSDIPKRNCNKAAPVCTGERAFNCDICGKTFKTKSNIQSHIRKVHSVARYPCEECGKVFKMPGSLKDHQKRVHTGERPFTCDICGNIFKTKREMLYHIRQLHSKARPYPCVQCGMAFKLPGTLKQHLLVHSDERPFGCDICGKTFKRRIDIQAHTRLVHSETRPNPCALCYKVFKSPDLLKKHQVVHSGGRPFVCDICGKTCKRKNEIQTHIMLLHSEARPYPCAQCGKAFKLLTHLKNHKLVHTGERRFSCDICGKKISTKRHMAGHMRQVHSEARPYPCAQCGKAFKMPNKLKDHQLVHTGGRPFSCDVCGKSFKRKHAIGGHMRQAHSDARPYPCAQCGKAFKLANKLKCHQLVHIRHIEARPYRCAQCGKAFRLPDLLKKHQLVHTRLVLSKKRPYACKQCGPSKAFKSPSALKYHQQMVHASERPFGCDICGKMFKRKPDVQIHAMLLHSEARPYPCAQCGKAFKLQGKLNCHQRTVHLSSNDSSGIQRRRGRPFGCDVCGKAFHSKQNVQKHIETSHINEPKTERNKIKK